MLGSQQEQGPTQHLKSFIVMWISSLLCKNNVYKYRVAYIPRHTQEEAHLSAIKFNTLVFHISMLF